MRTLPSIVALLSLVSSALAFNGDRASEGPLTIAIQAIATVTDYAPQPVLVVLSNTADAPLAVQVELTGLVDEWRAVGPTRRVGHAKPFWRAATVSAVASRAASMSRSSP